jgi:hypothetical protein
VCVRSVRYQHREFLVQLEAHLTYGLRVMFRRHPNRKTLNKLSAEVAINDIGRTGPHWL